MLASKYRAKLGLASDRVSGVVKTDRANLFLIDTPTSSLGDGFERLGRFLLNLCQK